MAARHYDGRFWAPGETAFHSHRKEAENAIRKNRKDIRMWEGFAERAAGEPARDQAQREIRALRFDIQRQERIVAEMDAKIAELVERETRQEGVGV